MCRIIIRRRAREPVFVGNGLCRYRYSPSGQQNRLRPTADIRVSGVTTPRSVVKTCRDNNISRSLVAATTSILARNIPSKRGLLNDNSRHCAGVVFARFVHTEPAYSEKMPESKPFERLPKNVLPKHYNLSLKPDLRSFTFEGKETVNIEVCEL